MATIAITTKSSMSANASELTSPQQRSNVPPLPSASFYRSTPRRTTAGDRLALPLFSVVVIYLRVSPGFPPWPEPA